MTQTATRPIRGRESVLARRAIELGMEVVALKEEQRQIGALAPHAARVHRYIAAQGDSLEVEGWQLHDSDPCSDVQATKWDEPCGLYDGDGSPTQTCWRCKWHRVDHSFAAGGIGHPLPNIDDPKVTR